MLVEHDVAGAMALFGELGRFASADQDRELAPVMRGCGTDDDRDHAPGGPSAGNATMGQRCEARLPREAEHGPSRRQTAL